MIFWVEESGNIMKHHKKKLKSSNFCRVFFLTGWFVFWKKMFSEGEKSPGKKTNEKKSREGTDGSPGIANWLQGRANHLRGREELVAASTEKQKGREMPAMPCCGAHGLSWVEKNGEVLEEDLELVESGCTLSLRLARQTDCLGIFLGLMIFGDLW